MDTSFCYTEKGYGIFNSDEKRWIKRMHELKAKYPDQVEIVCEPEKNGGSICFRIPTGWFKLRQPRKIHFSEGEIAKRTERIKRVNGE